MRKWLARFTAQDWCEFGGTASVSVGCFLIAPAVGFIVLGICLLFFGIALSRAE